jgi:esterase/lipase
MKVYFISGLGADQRAFRALQFDGIEPVYLPWLEPQRNESIEMYAKRMAEKITLPEPVIVGLSFGGMMAIEIAKHIPVKKIILLSSAKTKYELPFYFRICRWVPLHRILPLGTMARNPKVMTLLFGARTAEQQRTLADVINNDIRGFNDWAIDKVVNWKNTVYPDQVTHIHGSSDKLLLCRNVKADHIIRHGSHLMVVNQAKEVSALLKQLIPVH